MQESSRIDEKLRETRRNHVKRIPEKIRKWRKRRGIEGKWKRKKKCKNSTGLGLNCTGSEGDGRYGTVENYQYQKKTFLVFDARAAAQLAEILFPARCKRPFHWINLLARLRTRARSRWECTNSVPSLRHGVRVVYGSEQTTVKPRCNMLLCNDVLRCTFRAVKPNLFRFDFRFRSCIQNLSIRLDFNYFVDVPCVIFFFFFFFFLLLILPI